MAKALSNRNVCDANFNVADFTGEWLATFGKPELRGAWIIFGESGSGKTHFALSLLAYLTQFVDKAAYDTIEQGLSLSFKNSWLDANMAEVGNKVVVYSKEQIPALREEAAQAQKSAGCGDRFHNRACGVHARSTFASLMDEFPDKLSSSSPTRKTASPYPAVARHVRKLAEVKIRVEGFKAYPTTALPPRREAAGSL